MHWINNVLFAAAVAAAAVGGGSAMAGEENKNMNELPTPYVTVEGITEYRLANGLKVVLYPDASKPTATVNMTYLVGSRQENYGETGMAHLLEHLMFKGSKNYPHPTAEFTRRGFRMNGSTWLDRTNYFVSFNATDDNMKWAIGWQADAMVNSFIAQKDLDTEMTVVRNEYEMGENKPISVMMKRMQSVMFDWQSYGRSTIGARSDIENVEIKNLQAFYHLYYQPDNAVLTISGKFDRDQVLAWVNEAFGVIPKPTRVLPKEWTVEPTADGEREFFIRRKGEQQLVAVGYRIPSALADDYEATAMAADILADAPTGRLYKALVDTGMASQVFGWPVAAAKPGFVMFGAMVKKGDPIEPVKKKLIEEIENAFARSGVTEEELNRQKADQEMMFERTLSDPEEFGVELSDYIALGDWRLFFVDREQVKNVTPAQIDAAAAKYFVRDNRVVGLFVPDDHPKRAEIAQAPSAEELISRFTFKETGAEVEAFDSSQDNIDKRTQIIEVGDFDAAEVTAELKADVIDQKAAKIPFERIVAEYRPVEPARFVIDTPDKENAMLFARVDLPANLSDADMPALITADWIIGGSDGLSNRIVNRLRQKEGLSYGSGSNITLPSFGNRAKWSVGAIVAPQNLAQAEKSLKDELARAYRDGITEAELAEAKRGIIGSRAVNRAQDGMVASNWVNNLETGRTWQFSKETEAAIEALTVEDVNKALRRFCDVSKLTFALAGDLAKAKAAGKDFTQP